MAKRRKIVGLDALRCFAIILIVVYHCFPGALPGGFLAVELFFVISGFLIGQKLIRMKWQEGVKFGGVKSFVGFVWGRLKRFWPTLVFCMVLALSLGYFADPDLLTGARGNSLAAATFTTNIVSIMTGSTYENSLIPNVFNQTWFLALELQVCIVCYLVVAGFFRLFEAGKGKSRKRYYQLMVVSIAIALVSYGLMAVYGGWFGLYDRAYFGPDSHVGAFFMGVALAALTFARKMRPAKKGRKWIPTVALGLSVVGVGAMTPFVIYGSAEVFTMALPATAVLSVVMVASLLKLQSYREKKPVWILRLLEYVGALSFAIYLLHYSLNILLPDMLSTLPTWMVPYIVIVASVAFAVVLREILVPLSRKHKIWFYVLLVGSLVLPVMALVKAPEKSSIELQLEEAAELREEVPEGQESEAVKVDYIGAAELGGLVQGDVMKYFDEAQKFAKPHPVVVATAGYAAPPSGAGWAYYNTPLSDGSALGGKRVLVLGDSVVMGAMNDIYGTVPGVFVDALQSRNMTDAINLLAGYRASNGGNLPYIIVFGLVTNYIPFNAGTLQTIMDTAGPGHQFVFVTGYCGEYSRDAQNSVIRAVAASNGNVHVADWVPVVLTNLDGYTYADHTHLTPAGRQAYANLINGVVSGL